MNLEDVLLSEISQAQKDKYWVIWLSVNKKMLISQKKRVEQWLSEAEVLGGEMGQC
jgi:hypothetical protein